MLYNTRIIAILEVILVIAALNGAMFILLLVLVFTSFQGVE